MHVTVIKGSPRAEGNSATISRMLLETLDPYITQLHSYYLNGMSYRGCQACLRCKISRTTCVINDDLFEVFQNIMSSELVIITSPVYTGTVSAQAKGLFDRFYSLVDADFRTNQNAGRLPPGKHLVFILTQGNPDPLMHSELMPDCIGMFRRLGFEEIFPIRAVGINQLSDVRTISEICELVSTTSSNIVAKVQNLKFI